MLLESVFVPGRFVARRFVAGRFVAGRFVSGLLRPWISFLNYTFLGVLCLGLFFILYYFSFLGVVGRYVWARYSSAYIG